MARQGRKKLQLDEATIRRIRAALDAGAKRADVCKRFGFSDSVLVSYGLRADRPKPAKKTNSAYRGEGWKNFGVNAG
jgi:hypothetical protein